MKFKSVKSTIILVLSLIVLISLQSCGGNDNPTGTEQSAAPALPDMSTVEMDLSFFGLSPVAKNGLDKNPIKPEMEAAGTGKDNWINAAVRVFFVQLSFYAAFEAPVSAFAVAINSVPQKQPDGSWLWTYIYVDDGMDYGIFLYGTPMTDRVAWRMEVSTNDPAMQFDHFIWFSGEAMNDDSSGFWQFYAPVDTLTQGVPSVRIDWLNTANNEHQLSVLVNEAGSASEGDNLVFYVSPNENFLTFTDVSVPEVHTIMWYPDGSGSIEVPDYNGGVIACWDTLQKDMVCP